MNTQDTILSIKEKMKSVMPQGSEAILFGSRARGDYREDSDWDILILLDKDKINRLVDEDITYSLREFGWEINEQINPILFTKKDWENSKHNSLFYYNVMNEGITLWA
ncbi:MAG: nucleotidyltransferase domain-containing protein [Bacteroidales bacterium]|nr:nucleotidyltransferase domain-containing protein [Bacteroidales bacterium]